MSMERVIAESQDYIKVKLGDKMLANTVRLMREKQLITQKQLAYFCKIPPKVIESIEAGVLRPQLRTIKKIAAFFKVPHLTLLNVFEHQPQPQTAIEDKPVMQLVTPQNKTSSAVQQLQALTKRKYGKKGQLFSNPNAIRRCMAEKGWSYAQLAQASGLSRSCISRNISRPLRNRRGTLEKIAAALGVEMAQLVTNRNEYLKKNKNKKVAPAKPEIIHAKAMTVTKSYTVIPDGQMALPEFINLVTKIGKLSDANKRFVMEMVDKLVSV